MSDATFTFVDVDGFEIVVRKWMPPPGVRPKASVQIAHGAAEHSLRYARVAGVLNVAGYAVYANDHRGHGRTAGSLQRAGIAGADGWNGMLRDLKQLTDIINEESHRLPVFLLGHSMGSLLAQRYIQLWGDGLAGVVLSGTFGATPDLDVTIAALEPLARGATADAPCDAFARRFASFNQPFKPGETGFEWLSRDADEVQRYADDPWCGFAFSNAFVTDMMKGARDAWKSEHEAQIPPQLPILIIVGDQDPVGGNTATVTQLIERYRAAGLQRIVYKAYPGARHELFNETNRDEVHRDLVRWLDEQMR
jgi:alpha-beta hydrolase superfamily lysophospholipase